jgi:hypothetical protein
MVSSTIEVLLMLTTLPADCAGIPLYQIRFLAVRHLVPSKRTRNRCKQEVPMALEKTGLMRRRGEHAFAA